MIKQIQKDAKDRMEKAKEATRQEFNKVRTGKASPAILDNIMVEYYGTMVPISQVANIAAPEPRLVTIHPWEKKMLAIIEKAIFQSELGITPTSDGNIIRLPIPQLTEARRKDMVKTVHKLSEDGRVAIRNVRRDLIQKLKNAEKNSEIREDEFYRGQDEIQKMTDDYIKEIDEMVKHKEKEIMEV